ncbi:hypothetical protein [Streptomyces sp. NPDC056387]|uniref:hypothetical protein n=1 Tax=Streptomyces sp. NPDC056387 TaxID=3345803 RepID=UPI0035E0B6DB
MALIVPVFPAQRRGAALRVGVMVAGLATLSGPTLGGVLLSTVGRRWIFLVPEGPGRPGPSGKILGGAT